MDEATKAISEALHQHLGRWDELIAGKLAATIESGCEKIAVSIDRAAEAMKRQQNADAGKAEELAQQIEDLMQSELRLAPSQTRATLYAAASLLKRL